MVTRCSCRLDRPRESLIHSGGSVVVKGNDDKEFW